jgi:hypothetical protein
VLYVGLLIGGRGSVCDAIGGGMAWCGVVYCGLVGCGVFYCLVVIVMGCGSCGIGNVGGRGGGVFSVVVYGGVGRFGRDGGISLASLTARFPKNYSSLSSITAGFLFKFSVTA